MSSHSVEGDAVYVKHVHGACDMPRLLRLAVALVHLQATRIPPCDYIVYKEFRVPRRVFRVP